MPKVKKIIQPPDVQQSVGGHQQAGSFIGIEAVELPRAVVMKLAKSTGPDNMKLAKEVPIALTKASTVFINYLVAIAHEVAAKRSEKSLSAPHVLEACDQLDWSDSDELKRILKAELEAFRVSNAAKKVNKSVNQVKSTTSTTSTDQVKQNGSKSNSANLSESESKSKKTEVKTTEDDQEEEEDEDEEEEEEDDDVQEDEEEDDEYDGKEKDNDDQDLMQVDELSTVSHDPNINQD